jgi:hypothetical protein
MNTQIQRHVNICSFPNIQFPSTLAPSPPPARLYECNERTVPSKSESKSLLFNKYLYLFPLLPFVLFFLSLPFIRIPSKFYIYLPLGFTRLAVGIAQSVYRLATGWTVTGSNPGGGVFFRTRPDRPWVPPAPVQRVPGLSSGVKRPGRGAAPPPHLQCRGLKLGRAIALPILRALVACKGKPLSLPFTQLFACF